MKKRYVVILIACLAAVGLWRLFLFPYQSPYVQIPLTFLQISSSLPYVEAEVEGERCLLLLDLGSDSEIGLRKEIITSLKNKVSSGMVTWANVNGHEHASPKYQIPAIKIGKAVIENASVKEMDMQSEVKEIILWDSKNKVENEILAHRGGLIGRRLLCQQNLLFDFAHSVFFFVRDIQSLRKKGYFLESYLEVPFELNRLGIVFQIGTEMGMKKFALDSGASVSLVRPSSVLGEFLGARKIKLAKFCMGERSFGPIDLDLYEFVYPPKEIDGILGADFLKKHIVYFDFQNKIAYIN